LRVEASGGDALTAGPAARSTERSTVMWRVKILGAGLTAMVAMSLLIASAASATNPCKPVKGVSRCVFGTQTTPGGEPEPLHIGQTIQQEWWGRGSYFDAGRYSFLCQHVTFGGTVASFMGGAPELATPTTSFVGRGNGGACTSVMGDVQVSADSSQWAIQLAVNEPTPGQFVISDRLKTMTKEPIDFTAVYSEEPLPPVTCTWTTLNVRGTSPWVAGQQIMGTTPAQTFRLDEEASNSPQCSKSGKLETSWRFSATPPAGGLAPMVLAIH
jgi:hypothetical protein